jgi:outer membrane lipoprotein SlyB
VRPSVISLCAVAGSIIGGYLPAVLGDGSLFLSLLFGAIGGVAGVWAGVKISDY